MSQQRIAGDVGFLKRESCHPFAALDVART